MGWQDEAQLVSAAPPMAPSEVSPSWMQQASLVAPAPSGTSAASASGIFGAIQAGYQSSATGLALRGKLPDVVLDPQHSKWYERVLAGASELVSEAPEMIAGGLGGGIAGSAAGPIGTLLGGGAGAFALPASIRESLMQAYSKGAVQNSADFLDRASIVLKQTGKAGLIGAATAGAGGVAARVAGKALAPEIGFALSPEQAMTRIGAAQLGAEYGTMVVAPAALEGKLPEPEDFLNAAILIGGLKGALAVSGKLRSIYSATGVPPEKVFADASRDPALKDELTREEGAAPPEPESTSGLTFAEKMARKNEQERQYRTQLMAMTPDQIEVAAEQAIAHNYATEVTAVERFLGTDKRAEFESIKSRRAQDKWLDSNVTDEMQDWINEHQVPEEVFKEFRGAGGDFDESSPEALGRSIAIRLKDIDKPDFMLSADWYSIRTALQYAREQGWDMDTVLAGARARVVQWAGDDAPELFNRLFRAPGAPESAGPLRLPDLTARPSGEARSSIPPVYKPLADAATVREALPGREAEDLAESPFKDIPQPQGEPKIRGHVNYDYLSDREQLGPVAAAIADAYDRSIDTRSESWTESNAKAEQLLKQIAGGERPISDVVGWMPGQASLTAKVRAATDLLNGALTRFRTTADAFLAKGEDITEQDVEQLVRDGQRAGMIAPAVINDRAEMGRAFNILKETQGSAEAAGLVQKILSSYDGDPTALAKAARDMPTPAALSRLARKLTEPPTTMQKIQDIWKAGLLSGTKTYMVKAIGDAVNIMAQFPERAVAAALGALHGGEKVTPSEIAAYTFSMLHGTRAALRQGADAWNGVGPFEHREAIGGVAGKIVSIPHRIMSSETEFFRGLNEAGELGALAHRQAVKEGLIPGQDEFRSRVQSLTDSPTPEIQAGVKRAGDEGTYMAKLGQLGQAFQQLSRTTVGGFVLPFVRVPANLVKWGVRRMPGVAMMLDDVRADLAAGGAKRDLALARQAVGGALGYLAYQAVQDGALTGGGVSFTPEERRSKAAAGWQPYSLKIDGKWYSYNRFEPLAKVAMVAADIAEMNDRVEGDDKASLPMLVAAMFGHATISETYLSGLNGLMQAMTDPKEHGAQWAHQFLGSAVPAILAQSASAADPHKRVVDDWLDAIKSRLPGLRQTLAAQVNPLTGKPIENNATMLPVNVSKAADDQVLTEAARLQVNVTHAPKNLQVMHAAGKLGREELTAEERAAFDTAGGKLAHEILSEIVGAPGWEDVPDLIQKKIFARVLTQAHRYAASQALTPEKRAAYIEQVADKLRDELTQ